MGRSWKTLSILFSYGWDPAYPYGGIWETELWTNPRENLEEIGTTAKGKHTQPLGLSNLRSQCPQSEGKTLLEGVGAGGELGIER